MMRYGKSLHGYLIISRPTNDGAGKCLWAFARRDGREYFVKEFLEPKRPNPRSMGTDRDKALLAEQCAAFEDRHRSVMAQLDPNDLDAGNLVLATDFFAEGTQYYKVTPRLYPATGVLPHDLPPGHQAVLLGTLITSLRLLHRHGIVHGDLTPRNVLLHRPHGDLFTAKLIDFDDSYVSGRPPDRDTIGGDASYAAPEWLRYLRDPDLPADRLTTAVDVFAFGLLVHGYLAGDLPGFGARHDSVAEAVEAGETPVLDARLSGRAAAAIAAMLDPNPEARPKVDEVQDVLTDPAALDIDTHPVVAQAKPELARPAPRSRLRINLDGSR